MGPILYTNGHELSLLHQIKVEGTTADQGIVIADGLFLVLHSLKLTIVIVKLCHLGYFSLCTNTVVEIQGGGGGQGGLEHPHFSVWGTEHPNV